MNKSQQIRDYAAANPNATAKDISTALGTKNNYVHTVLWALKAKGRVGKTEPRKTRPTPKKWKTLHISTSDTPVVEDKVTDTYKQRMVELAYQAGKGRNRVHPVTGKILMQGPDPLPVTMHEPKADPVNQPAHYKYGGIETIDFIEAKELGYNLGNVIKYITRADHKGNRKQDLEKALWYLKREIDSSIF